MMGGYGRGFGTGYTNMMGGGWAGGLLLLFFGLLVLVGIVLLVMWAIRASHGTAGAGGSAPPAATPGHDEAVAVARRRLASGEITREQYDDIMTALG